MTPLERLLQEEIPVRPETSPGVHSVWTQQDQDRHWTDLANSVGAPGEKRPGRPVGAAAGEAGGVAA
jgi:hypothetical protein